MNYVVKNYQIVNPQEENEPDPIEDKDGLKLKATLDKVGYSKQQQGLFHCMTYSGKIVQKNEK